MNPAQFVRTFRSELLKGGTQPVTKVLVPIVVVSAAVAYGMVALDRRALDYDKAEFITPSMVLLGFLLFGVLVLLVVSAWSYVGEASNGSLRETYRVTPQRPVVVVAKAAVAAMWGAVTALLSLLAAIGVIMASGVAHVTDELLRPDLVLGLPLVTAAWSIIALAVGVMVRSVIPALGGLVIWYALLEDFLKDLPGIGVVVRAVGPFRTGQTALGLGDTSASPEHRWLAALALAAGCALILVLSIVVESRRDVRVAGSA